MSAEFESRVSTLEEKARAQGVLNEHYSAKLDAIAAGISRLETLAAIAVAKACPAPGKCLVLEQGAVKFAAETEALRAELSEVKRYIAEQRGGWKVLVMIAGAAGTIGSFIGWLFSNFHWPSKGPTP